MCTEAYLGLVADAAAWMCPLLLELSAAMVSDPSAASRSRSFTFKPPFPVGLKRTENNQESSLK